jgi:type I restriction enzyme M protein
MARKAYSNHNSDSPSPATIDFESRLTLTAASEGEKPNRSVDLLGHVYEYFLTRFARAESKNGGQFYTPSCVVRPLVEMPAPYEGRFYDPSCCSVGMFLQSDKFVESYGGKLGDISNYGQDKWARRHQPKQDKIIPQVVSEAKHNFRNDDDMRWQLSGSRSTTKGSPQDERGDVHQIGVPPNGNANFTWVGHFIHRLAPHGMAAFVLANGSMSSNQLGNCNTRSVRREWATNSQGLGSQSTIRRALIEAALVDCMVTLPDQLIMAKEEFTAALPA